MCGKGCILLMCGLPSSGKTLLTNNLVNHSKLNPILFKSQSNVVFYKISIDELIPISEQYSKIQTESGFWKKFRHNLRIATNLFINQLIDNKLTVNEIIDENVSSLLGSIKRQNNLSENNLFDNKCEYFVVIIDDNFYYKSMRYEFFQTSKKLCLGFAIIMINCSLELSLNRNQNRSEDKRLPEDVIIKMNERFECPKPEGFEFRTHFIFADSFDYNIAEELIEFIVDSIDNPIIYSTIRSPIEEDIRRTLNIESKNNLIHKIDCILRQIINEIIVQSFDKKSIAKTLNESKKCLLNDLKKSIDLLSQNIVEYLIKNENNIDIELNNEIKQFFTNLLNNR